MLQGAVRHSCATVEDESLRPEEGVTETEAHRRWLPCLALHCTAPPVSKGDPCAAVCGITSSLDTSSLGAAQGCELADFTK
ncbi:hypothetical protein GN956_G5901 [Arapaima gigas]